MPKISFSAATGAGGKGPKRFDKGRFALLAAAVLAVVVALVAVTPLLRRSKVFQPPAPDIPLVPSSIRYYPTEPERRYTVGTDYVDFAEGVRVHSDGTVVYIDAEGNETGEVGGTDAQRYITLARGLMDNDAQKLRSFGFRSSVFQWLKTTAIRFFIKKRNRMIEDSSHETPYMDRPADGGTGRDAEDDLERLFSLMPNKRYVMVIRRLILDDMKPELLAKEMGINTANLYNIRRRAIAQLSRVCLMDIHYYGK